MAFVVDVEVAAGTSPIRARFRGVDALVPHRGSGSATADPDIGGFVRHVAGSLASDGHGRATANADSDHVWTTPSIPNALSMAIVPLPTEPIGRGARWHVAGADPGLGVSDAELDYEATALDTDGATVRWTGNVHKDGLAIQLEGTATVRFTELLPAHTTIVQHVPPQPGGIPALDFVITIE